MRVASAPSWFLPLSLSANASAWMDLLRAIAAILVLLYHWRNVFFVDYAELEQSNFAFIFIYFITGLGHQAVIVFFVLSGFFIGNLLLNDFCLNRVSPIKYAIDRLTRLYVVLLPSLIVCFAWDYMGQKIYGVDGIYSGVWPSLTYSVVERGTAQIFLGNVLYLQNILVYPYGSNNPLWSLANEFWYYVLFPCCFFALICKNYLTKLLFILMLFGLVKFLGFEIMIGFLYWSLGVMISLLARRTLIYDIRFGWIGLAFAFFGFLIALACVRLHWIESGLWADFFIAIIFSLFLLVLIHARIGTSLGGYFEKLSAFSFSLYLVHMPPLVFFAAAMGQSERYQPNFSNVMGALGILLILILWSWVFYLCTEKHTSTIRSWIYRIVGVKSGKLFTIN